MSYESWRISYQSSEQAARAAYAKVEELAACLADLERYGEEPVFWYRPRSDGQMHEGPIHNAQIERVRRLSGAWVPLYTRPAPAGPVNARLLEALKKCRNRFAFYVEHHRAKGDSVRADDNAQFVKLADEAITAAEAQQERLLQDMHDAGREIDRVMAEAAPKAVRLTEVEVDACFDVSDGTRVGAARAIETAVLRKNGIEVTE